MDCLSLANSSGSKCLRGWLGLVSITPTGISPLVGSDWWLASAPAPKSDSKPLPIRWLFLLSVRSMIDPSRPGVQQASHQPRGDRITFSGFPDQWQFAHPGGWQGSMWNTKEQEVWLICRSAVHKGFALPICLEQFADTKQALGSSQHQKAAGQ